MITSNYYRDDNGNIMQQEHLYGLSTDTKPTKGVPNGSIFDVVDKGMRYLFDAENEEWFLFAKTHDLDTTDATASASDILSGKTAYISEEKVTGEIETKTASDITISDNTVTIPKGYYSSQKTKTVGTAQAAQTITPTTSDQTIAAGKYLTGAQTIKGDANLIAENIKSGVTIFGVEGTYTGEDTEG